MDKIQVSFNVLLCQVKLYSNSRDSRLLTRISSIMSIEDKYILITKHILLSCLDYKGDLYDANNEDFTIDFLLMTLFKESPKLQGVYFEIDDTENFTRVFGQGVGLNYKIIEAEIIVNVEKESIIKEIGFSSYKNPNLFWIGLYQELPKAFKKLKNINSIFGDAMERDNPGLIVKFNHKFLPNKPVNNKLLDCF